LSHTHTPSFYTHTLSHVHPLHPHAYTLAQSRPLRLVSEIPSTHTCTRLVSVAYPLPSHTHTHPSPWPSNTHTHTTPSPLTLTVSTHVHLVFEPAPLIYTPAPSLGPPSAHPPPAPLRTTLFSLRLSLPSFSPRCSPGQVCAGSAAPCQAAVGHDSAARARPLRAAGRGQPALWRRAPQYAHQPPPSERKSHIALAFRVQHP
jgi:hypothetical protein